MTAVNHMEVIYKLPSASPSSLAGLPEWMAGVLNFEALGQAKLKSSRDVRRKTEAALSTCLDTSLNSIAGMFPQPRDTKRQNSGDAENDWFPPQRLPGSPEGSESLCQSRA